MMNYTKGKVIFLPRLIQTQPKSFELSFPSLSQWLFEGKEGHFSFHLSSDHFFSNKTFRDHMGNCLLGFGFFLSTPLKMAFNLWEQSKESIKWGEDDEDNIEISYQIIRAQVEFEQNHDLKSDMRIPITGSFLKNDLKIFILKLASSEVLHNATNSFLLSLAEPNAFLTHLYKSYEILGKTKTFNNEQVKRFTRLANDPSIIGSRHASSTVTTYRWLTPEERDLSVSIIRKGIVSYSKSVMIFNL